MCRHLLVLMTCMLSLMSFLCSAQVRVEGKLERPEMRVGEQQRLQLRVYSDFNTPIHFPPYSAEAPLTPGIEVMRILSVDTLRDEEAKEQILRCNYLLTSFDSAVYAIEPFVVVAGDTVYISNKLGLKVNTVSVDTLHREQFNGAFAPFESEFHWSWSLWLLSMAACVALVVLWFIVRRLMLRPREVEEVVLPSLPSAEELTRESLREIDLSGDVKLFYDKLTFIFRRYVSLRFGISALEMTTSELQRVGIEKDVLLLGEKEITLLRVADMVKFAKYEATIEERQEGMAIVAAYVAQTQRAPEKAVTTTRRVVDTSLFSKKYRLQIFLVVGLLTLIIGLSVYVAFNLLNSFF